MELFITDQHRGKIREYFAVMNHYMEILEKVTDVSSNLFKGDQVLQAAGERAFHIVLECVTDVGNLIIDALIMRDPSSYEDIVQVLAEENVFPKEFTNSFIEAVKFRRVLAHDYLERDVETLYEMIKAHKEEFPEFQRYVADYVKLGSLA